MSVFLPVRINAKRHRSARLKNTLYRNNMSTQDRGNEPDRRPARAEEQPVRSRLEFFSPRQIRVKKIYPQGISLAMGRRSSSARDWFCHCRNFVLHCMRATQRASVATVAKRTQKWSVYGLFVAILMCNT